MTDITRLDQLELIHRLNDLERSAPIYRQALAWIVEHGTGEAVNVARLALDDTRPRPVRQLPQA